MRSSTALLDAVTSLTHPLCSRIPHLRAHIEFRSLHFPVSAARVTSKTLPKRRLASTFLSLDVSIEAHAEDHDRTAVTEQHAEEVAVEVARKSTGPTAPSFSNVHTTEQLVPRNDAHHAYESEIQERPSLNMYDLMQENNPERTLYGLLDPTIGDNFIRAAEDGHFAQAFAAAQLTQSIKLFRGVHEHMGQEREQEQYATEHFWIKPLARRFQTLMASLLHIVEQRRASGHRVELEIHTQLLKCAFDTGDAATAAQIFRHLMPSIGIEPDLKCYNFFMGALCWSNAYSPQERFKFRVLPRYLALRASAHPPASLSGHAVAGLGQSPEQNERSVRTQVLNLFKQLSRQGLQGDEHTYMHLMTAMGREGDLAGVTSILKSVWNVDVHMLGAYDEEEVQSPTFYEEGHSLRPSQRLLLTVAHIYGSNNKVESAIRLVDYISRNYNLYVSYEVWQQLCSWAMVLGIKRSATMRFQGQHTGKVGPDVFESLWKIMTDEPHNVKPNMVMLCMHLRMQMDVLNLHKTRATLQQAKDLLEEGLADLRQETEKMLAAIASVQSGACWDGLISAKFFRQRRVFLLSSLRVERDARLLWAAIRRILRRPGWQNAGYRAQWNHRELPRMVEWLADRAPSRIVYTTKTGLVDLDRGLEKRNGLQESGEDQLRLKAAKLRRMLDTEDHASLVENIHRGLSHEEPFGRE